MVQTADLDELTSRVRGARAAAGASLEVSLGNLLRRMDRQAMREAELDRAVQPVNIPAVLFVVTGGVVQASTSAQALLGPEDGQVWHLGRVSLVPVGAAFAATDLPGIFRELTGLSGQGQNKLKTMGAAPNDTWEPTRIFLRSPETLSLVGSGLSGGITGIYLSAEAVAVEAGWISRYLL